MAGFAAIIGGLGGAAQQYGQQVRGLLEQRRSHFADLMTNLAAQESDPQRRAAYLSHASDLLSGKDIAKIAPAALKDLQEHAQSNEALAQMVGGPPQAPRQTPVPASPGQVPGTATAAVPPAAQPSGSPVQPQFQQLSPMVPVGTPVPPPQQPAPAASAVLPVTPTTGGLPDLNIQDPMSIVHKYMTHPMYSAPANRPALNAAMQQELSHNEALRQTVEQAQATLQVGLQRLGMMNDPRVQHLAEQLRSSGYPEILIPSLIGSSLGIQMPPMSGIMGAMFTPTNMRGLTADQVLHNWPDEAREAGITPGSGPVDVQINKITGRPERIGAKSVRGTMAPGVDAQGNVTMMMVNPFQGPGAIAPVGGVTPVPASQVAPHFQPTATGGVQMITPAQMSAGAAPTQVPGAVAPSMLPRTTTSLRSITTQDENGNPVTRLEPVTSTSTRGGAVGTQLPPASPRAGGALTTTGTPSAGGPREFQKPFTPEQKLKGEQQLGQYNLAIDRISKIQDQLPLLNSMIESGKLNLEMDSNHLVRAIINRALPMTPSEAQFVGNFRTMMEDINLLRGPMGATGFRGPEAWAALQAQRGQLLAHPEITKQVLTNTLTALRAQQQPLQQRFGGRPTATTPAEGETVEFVRGPDGKIQRKK